jgi:uncharacterized protein HemY
VVVVYEKIVAGRARPGVPAFVVSLLIVVPVTLAFARVFASVFETPSRHGPRWSLRARRPARAPGQLVRPVC